MSSMNHEHTGPDRHAPAGEAASGLTPLRSKLAGTRGKQYWRSLEEVAGTPEFSEYLHREFPENASEWLDPKGRRGFLKLMGASLALAGVSACTKQPDEQIVPYVRQPEELVPGRPLFYATAMPLSGTGVGLLVESHEGRPTKIEGNPDHPSSRGASDVFAQASILELYDPDRSQMVTHLGDIRPYAAFVAAMHNVLEAQKGKQGAGIRILSETVSSPTLAWQIRELLTRFPSAKHVQYESAGRHSAREGSRLAFGEYVDVHYAVENADVIVSLDADFLCAGPDALRHARAFASRRRGEGASGPLNRFYAVESTPTNTGTRADHRLPLKASEMEAFARALAGALGVPGVANVDAPAAAKAWLAPLVADLKAAAGRSLLVAGDGLPPAVHAIVHAINEALGTVGTTTSYTRPAEANAADQFASIASLTAEMKAGAVDLLLILGGNPVYTAPADLEFDKAIEAVALRVHHGLYQNETARLSHWHIPEAHFLETWSDVRAHDGTATIIQPLIAPLYHGKSAHEVLTAFSDRTERTSYDIVREFWAKESMLATEAAVPESPAAARPAAAAVPVPAPPAGAATASTAASPAAA
ncbi:MAG: TAT-variant-translocated molybdopterin oxidoreductase, partial [Vicinamibacterales bacterium]